MTATAIIAGGTVVFPSGRRIVDILVRDGLIAAIGEDLAAPAGTMVIDATALHVLPGVIDPHSHFWEAGFAARPDFADSSASAAAGGVTTTIDMPLTEPVVVNRDAFDAKVKLGERTSYVDFALHGGVTPYNLGELEAMWDAGAAALKIFTCETGSPMTGVTADADLAATMATIAGFGGLATFHAESAAILDENLANCRLRGSAGPSAFCEWHDERAECDAIERILSHAERLGTRANIVHVTSPRGVALAEAARARGVDVTTETCPHYLYFTADDIGARGLALACAPPMRGGEAKDGLRRLLADGMIATYGSDHCPVDPRNKRSDDLARVQPGLPGNETMVPLLLNLVAESVLTLERMASLTSEVPARRYGLYPRKGAIAVGSDADFTIVDPNREWTIREASLVGSAGWTPYEGMTVRGRVEMTIIRGRLVAKDGRLVGAPGGGAFIARNGTGRASRTTAAQREGRPRQREHIG